MALDLHDIGFQVLIGTLKTTHQKERTRVPPEFQVLIGTLKTDFNKASYVVGCLFQVLIGTLKTM